MLDPIVLAMVAIAALLLLAQAERWEFAVAGGGEWGDVPAPKKERKAWEDLLVFKKGGGSAPAPDPNVGKAALENIKLGKDWLSFAKDQFKVGNARQAKVDALSDQVTRQQLSDAKLASQRGSEQFERYKRLFQPVEDRIVSDAMTYDSPKKQAAAAAAAKADVLGSAADAEARSQRQMASMGINPASGRFAGIDRAGDLQTALAAAGAQNKAREQVKMTGMALREGVANMGRGATSTAAQQTSLGLNAGSSAMGNKLAAEGNWQANNAIMGQGFQGAIGANASGAGILNQQYGNQLSAWSAKQQADATSAAGLMGGLGTLGGAALMMSSEDYKEDKQPVKDGAALEAIDQMPVESWKYKDGIGDGGHHIGPYAEDFQAATGKGDGKSIPVVDAIGVTMKAVQELNKKVKKMEKRHG